MENWDMSPQHHLMNVRLQKYHFDDLWMDTDRSMPDTENDDMHYMCFATENDNMHWYFASVDDNMHSLFRAHEPYAAIGWHT